MEYKVEVNLNGPDGNAFALMRKAKYLGVKLDLSKISGDVFSLVNTVEFLEGESKIKEVLDKVLDC